MVGRSARLALGAAAALIALTVTPAAQAEDFLSALFGAFGGSRARVPVIPLPFGNEGNNPGASARAGYFGGSQAYCVRSCDGRYFPLAASDNQSRAASCNGFCPASETRIVYGSNIDNAVTESGKPYSELPNAFRYRNEIVAGCTCTGKSETGLAPVKVQDDPTLRNGDIVAGANGLEIARKAGDRRGVSMNFTPMPQRASARIQGAPVVASE